jgi:Tfp pilus assembly protein PilN
MREDLTTLDAAVSRCSAHRKEMEALSQSRQKERAKLSAPVLVLEAIQIVLSDGAWLKAMEISGSQVTIKGEALSEHEVFETFERLRGVPFLNDVKVDSTRLIPTSERQTQEFTVRAIFVGEPLSEKIS